MKRLLLFGLFIHIYTSAFSQTWEELNKLSDEFFKKEQYDKAIPIVLKTIEAAKKEFGSNHFNYAVSLYNLGSLYVHVLQYSQAELYLLQAKDVFEKSEQVNNLNYSLLLNNLAILYERLGLPEKAEPLHLKGLEIRKRLTGEDSPDYALGLNSTAVFYVNLGQYEKAEKMHKQAIEIQKKSIGTNHPDYVTSINNLAFLYKTMGLFKEAERLYLEVKEKRKQLLGENHVAYANILNNLGSLYTRMMEYEKAESYLMEAKEIRGRLLGENHPNYTNTLNNLAILYEQMEFPEKAEPLYKQTLEIRKKTLGEAHPDYAQSLNNLAIFYIHNVRSELAESLALTATEIKLKNLKRIFGILTEKEKSNYLINTIEQSNINNSLILQNPFPSSRFVKANFELQLFLKSLALSETIDMLSLATKSKDPVIKQLLNNWQSNKRILARQYVLPENRRILGIDSIESETEKAEKELSRLSSAFFDQQNIIKITTKNIQDKLESDEAAIDFIRFRLYHRKGADSTIYAAYVMSKNDSVPIFVPLCEEKELQKLFDSAGSTATAMVSNFYRGLEVKNNRSAGALGKELFKLIWQPIEPFLKGVKKISYSPTGNLYSIAFHALPVDRTTLLMDKYQIQQYTSTRQVILREQETQNSKPRSIALFGDATFTLDSLQIVKGKTKTEKVSANINVPQNRGTRGGTWNSLPGTADEIDKIKSLFVNNKISTKTFTQSTASEENLKALSGNSPQILHIATHGFFLPEPDKKKKENNFNNENTYTLAEDPLLRSGLILAGGNYAWSGKTPIDGVEDGIATAYEISQLNLSNTELVVLSACETALGDVKGSEGVFGLQRAFKMAGVKKMIVSLWQVPDKETAELMSNFYFNWMKGKTINDAFTLAQAEMRKKYSPFYWAAFVLVE